jgi:hypothetical protein
VVTVQTLVAAEDVAEARQKFGALRTALEALEAGAPLLVVGQRDREGGDAGGDEDRQPDEKAELLAPW